MQSLGLFLMFLAAVILLRTLFGKRESRAYRPENSPYENPLSDAILRKVKSRRDYYRDDYLKSDAWQRKRYVVLKRDNWRCVYCGAPATQVHHKKYARKNIGKEPIDWLVSVCKSCHDQLHY
jgi:5-methylcytosine-specific restriction endonuclease McrA